MKIAFLSRYSGISDRGVETYVKELADRLAKDYQVEVLTGKDSDSIFKIIHGKYDIVIPTNGRLQALKVSVARLFSKHKMIISGQSGIGRDDIWNIFITKPDVFIALTDLELKWAKTWAWGTKIIKIPNGVDLKKFNKNGEKIDLKLSGPIVLSVGALSWYKHHELTIAAMEKVQGSLLIIGSGEEKENLENLANKKIPGRFKIMTVKFEDIPKYYRSADLFVLPSWNREAFGIVYVEALSSGLPVVAPDDESRREIIGEAGILVDTNDSNKYGIAISDALKKNWGSLPRDQAEKFSWDEITLDYKNLFESLK